MRVEVAQQAAFQAELAVDISAERRQFTGSKPGDDGNAAKEAEEVATMQGKDLVGDT